MEKKYEETDLLYDNSYEDDYDMRKSPNPLGRGKGLSPKELMEKDDTITSRSGDKASYNFRMSPNTLGRGKFSDMSMSVTERETIEPKISGKLDTPVLKDFKTAFKEARKEGVETFMYGGKKFSTATAEDVKKAGYSNLKDYLNSKFKKKVQNETPMDLS